MTQVKRKNEVRPEWMEVSSAFQDDLVADIGRHEGQDSRDHSVRIRRQGYANSLEIRSWELPKLASLVQWTADAVSVLPTVRRSEADDMGCLAACLEDTLGRMSMRSVLRLDANSNAAEAFRTIVECMLELEEMNFASEPCMEHVYRRLLLLDRWLAGASNVFLETLAEGVEIDQFGVCPLCCSRNSRFNIHRSHWFVCHAHRVCWCPGENLFPDWRQECETTWQKNVQLLKDYKVVECMHSPAHVR